MPIISQKAWNQLGFNDNLISSNNNTLKWGLFSKGQALNKEAPLFPRR
jgi:hypothetical protein